MESDGIFTFRWDFWFPSNKSSMQIQSPVLGSGACMKIKSGFAEWQSGNVRNHQRVDNADLSCITREVFSLFLDDMMLKWIHAKRSFEEGHLKAWNIN